MNQINIIMYDNVRFRTSVNRVEIRILRRFIYLEIKDVTGFTETGNERKGRTRNGWTDCAEILHK